VKASSPSLQKEGILNARDLASPPRPGTATVSPPPQPKKGDIVVNSRGTGGIGGRVHHSPPYVPKTKGDYSPLIF